jgi:hypothetical protein
MANGHKTRIFDLHRATAVAVAQVELNERCVFAFPDGEAAQGADIKVAR